MSVHEFDPRTGLFRETLSVFGRSTAGRLGASVASLGDLDGDGRGDFAAGAPFEDGGRGAVHVFLGKADVESIQGESFWKCFMVKKVSFWSRDGLFYFFCTSQKS